MANPASIKCFISFLLCLILGIALAADVAHRREHENVTSRSLFSSQYYLRYMF